MSTHRLGAPRPILRRSHLVIDPDWDEDAYRRQEAQAAAEPCDHYARTDWIDEQTCGCGTVVDP